MKNRFSAFFAQKSQDVGLLLDCPQAGHVLCLQARYLLYLQPGHLLRQQTRDLQSAKTSPGHCRRRGGRFAAAPVWTMRRECLGRLQISCLLTQQMSWLQTREMSCLQTQRMSCLQTSLVNETQHLRVDFEVLDPDLGCLVLEIQTLRIIFDFLDPDVGCLVPSGSILTF